MPQMAPMSWTLLYLMFTILFLLINFMNYYSYLIKSPSLKNNKILIKSLNWKW